MRLKDGVCDRCNVSKDKRNKSPYIMSDDNEMDPGEVPGHLPKLSQVEEMLISHTHVHLEARRVRGHQYQYTGHTVCFMNNTTKLYDTLPLLPHQLDLLCCDQISRAMSHKSGQPNHLSNKSKYVCYSKTNSRATRANKYACYQRKTNTCAPEENKYMCFHIHNILKQYEQAEYPQPKKPQRLFERSSKPLSTFLTSLL